MRSAMLLLLYRELDYNRSGSLIHCLLASTEDYEVLVGRSFRVFILRPICGCKDFRAQSSYTVIVHVKRDQIFAGSMERIPGLADECLPVPVQHSLYDSSITIGIAATLEQAIYLNIGQLLVFLFALDEPAQEIFNTIILNRH
jgi:hypothetical protein